MKIAISAESTCDLNKELIEKYDIKIIPYKIILGDKTYNDGELKVEEIFDFVDKNKVLPKTTAINEYEYTEYFKSLKNEYDAVIHTALSSGITSSCGNAIRAADSLENVYVVNSKTLSSGIALLAIYARELADKGLDAKTIFEKVSKRTESLQVSFVIERLDYLYKGGRCSGFQLFGANILKIRPRIIVKDGKMTKDKMYHGSMGMVVNKYCADILKEYNNPDLTRVFITYPTATIEMASNARQALIEAGFKEIIETRAGGTIASHCGGNTLGILYFNDGGKVD